MNKTKKKSKRNREEEIDFGVKKSSGVDYNLIQDRPVHDARFERQRLIREGVGKEHDMSKKSADQAAPSATMDAFMRMVTGKEERTIADRISDPHRPTWDQYKQANKDKLSLKGTEEKDMMAYRKELDKERKKALSKRNKEAKKNSDSDSMLSDSDEDSRARRRKSKKKRKRKDKKSKKSKKRRKSESDSDDDSDDSDGELKKKKSKKKKKNKSKSPSPVRLSSFFDKDYDSDK